MYGVDDILVPIFGNSLMYNTTSLKYLQKVRVKILIEDTSTAIVEIIEEPTGTVRAANGGCVTSMAKKDMTKSYGLGDTIMVDLKYFVPAITMIKLGSRKIDWRIKLIMMNSIPPIINL